MPQRANRLWPKLHLRQEHQQQLREPLSALAFRAMLDAEAGITVLDDAETMTYPTARQATGQDGVFVGRIREDLGAPNGLACWVVADNLRKGAASNAVDIAELLLGS